MAIVGLAGSALLVFLCSGDFWIRGIAALMLGATLVIVIYIFNDPILAGLARSGSPEELLTATGRTNIWEAAIALWLEHPVFGLGFNSSLQILPRRADLFTAAAHTHNVFLEILFSGGLVGLGLFTAALIATVRRAAMCHRYSEIGILTFFVIHGLTEPLVFGTIAFPSLAFFAAVVLAFTCDRVASDAVPPRDPLLLSRP
jgi:O-antigen ligase